MPDNPPARGGGRGRGKGRGRGRGRGRGGGAGVGTVTGDGGGGGAGEPTQLSQLWRKAEAQATPPSPTPDLNPTQDSDNDSEVCFICANPIQYTAISPCNHRSCHVCALRLRALYKTNDCSHCRSAAPFVIFTEDHDKNYTDFSDTDIELTDDKIGIRYASADISKDTLILLRYNCPDENCDFQAIGWQDLHRHVKSVHQRRMCDLCSRNKKVFTHEHALLTDREHETHVTRGDDQPGSLTQTGFRGHPRCDFCRERFYDADKLFEHCRNKHERCFLCDRDNPSTPHYYRNYDDLEEHFRKDHFLCATRECLEKKFVVFASQMDLKAHQLEEHGDTLSKDVRRDARVVDMSAFDIRPLYQQQGRRGGGGDDRRNRGRDLNSDAPLPPSSAQPLRRDEIAFQRQLAIHSAQSVTSRSFGGQLTQPSNNTTGSGSGSGGASSSSQARSATPQQQQQQQQQHRQPPSSSQQGTGELPSQMQRLDMSALSPQDRARHQQHTSVIEKAKNLLGHNDAKLNKFRAMVSAYKQGSQTATQLIEGFLALFETASSTAVGTLLREVAELYENPDKREGLLRSWRDWRAINEDYPSLPVPNASGASGRGSSESGGWSTVTASQQSRSVPISQPSHGEVLRMKKSTRKGASNSHNLAAVVSSSSGRSRAPASSSASSFPSLPKAGASSSSLTQAPKPSWTSSGSQGNKPNPGKVSINSKDAFPSLPAAPRPQTTIFGYGKGAVRRDFAQKKETGFSWGSGPSDAPPEEEDSGAQTGKGKKKGKKVLLNWT